MRKSPPMRTDNFRKLPNRDDELLAIGSPQDRELDGVPRAVRQPEVDQKLRLAPRLRIAIDGQDDIPHRQPGLLELWPPAAEQPLDRQGHLIGLDAATLLLGRRQRIELHPLAERVPARCPPADVRSLPVAAEGDLLAQRFAV